MFRRVTARTVAASRGPRPATALPGGPLGLGVDLGLGLGVGEAIGLGAHRYGLACLRPACGSPPPASPYVGGPKWEGQRHPSRKAIPTAGPATNRIPEVFSDRLRS